MCFFLEFQNLVHNFLQNFKLNILIMIRVLMNVLVNKSNFNKNNKSKMNKWKKMNRNTNKNFKNCKKKVMILQSLNKKSKILFMKKLLYKNLFLNKKTIF